MATPPPPSQFAALLRQSKFASFDPKIAQSYVSFGGHCHRGNWGFKRPLPIRRRKATVTVKAIDSREEQTEWRSAEQQSRWIRMWEEVGVTPRVEFGSWAEKLGPYRDIQWDIDSEFSQGTKNASSNNRAEEKGLRERSTAVPNVHAMSDSEFERYLHKLRQLRPEFREYLQQQTEKSKQEGRKDSDEPVTLWRESHRPNQEQFKDFLQYYAYQRFKEPNTHLIEQQPQRFGGLNYSHSPPLQNHLFTKPSQGRLLQSNITTQRGGKEGYVASFAGVLATMRKGDRGSGVHPMDWNALEKAGEGISRNPNDGVVTDLRFRSAELVSAPSTVAQHSGGKDSLAIIRTEVYSVGTEHHRRNTHIPGTREYVANDEDEITTASMLTKQPTTTTPKFDDKVTADGGHRLMDVLSNMIKSSTGGTGQTGAP